MGFWVGEGSGDPGKGSGRFSFALDLDEKILVRRHHAEFPAAGGRPAASHDDLLITYRSEPDKATKAIYFDNEGHVIHYTASFSSDGRNLTFLSDATTAGPRFRLSYTAGQDGELLIKFEIAPPGNPDAFKTYVEGKARRAKGTVKAEGLN
jgi:hypothetical protein